ncbi:hypothetical protein GLAREA_10091 [Glarea lozoyensis ATCC 20868]|uniref:Uncharacterized protein n=1 Tax=Glarea lozoyensis (strain ATCC 20868 / MF5171) TaxID=1116229 RepID=S3D7C8_GLAL2|nr:uncharacterized protein GLAREA_10091 [Glarea lozoyensis ATCC 20868]EPE34397.1 hypothetical protein GLAREA_10091 [Glarea lozoyensis ATCC 20868]
MAKKYLPTINPVKNQPSQGPYQTKERNRTEINPAKKQKTEISTKQEETDATPPELPEL